MAITISIEGVSRRFGELTALNDVSLSVAAGEFFTLLGPSGSGKSTLLNQLAGFDQPDSGRILFDGQDMNKVPANKRPSNTVFQDLALFPHMNVASNVAYGLRIRGTEANEINQRVDQALALVGLEGFAERDVNRLSGGQRQRVALARSLIMEPGVLLLDEPLTGLDENLRQQMRDEFGRLHERTGATFILVTHNQDEALSLSNRMAVMRQGHVEQLGTPQDFFERPANSFIARFMGMECMLRPSNVRDENKKTLAEIGGLVIPVHRAGNAELATNLIADPVLVFRPDQLGLLAPSSAAASDRPVLELRVAHTRYRGVSTDVQLEFPDGQQVTVAHPAQSDIPLPASGERALLVFATGAPLLLGAA